MLLDVPLNAPTLPAPDKSRAKKDELNSSVSSTFPSSVEKVMDVTSTTTPQFVSSKSDDLFAAENVPLAAPMRKTPEKKSADGVVTSPSQRTKEEKKEKEMKKKMRKDTDKEPDLRPKKEQRDRLRKGKQQPQLTGSDQVEADAEVDSKPRNLREAAKAMPRIPKISERNPVPTRDPRLQKPVGESAGFSLSFLSFPGSGQCDDIFDGGASDGGGGGGGVGGSRINRTVRDDDVQVIAFRSGRNATRPRKRPTSPEIQGRYSLGFSRFVSLVLYKYLC